LRHPQPGAIAVNKFARRNEALGPSSGRVVGDDVAIGIEQGILRAAVEPLRWPEGQGGIEILSIDRSKGGIHAFRDLRPGEPRQTEKCDEGCPHTCSVREEHGFLRASVPPPSQCGIQHRFGEASPELASARRRAAAARCVVFGVRRL